MTAAPDDLSKLDPSLTGWLAQGGPGDRAVVVRLDGPPDAALAQRLGALGVAAIPLPVLTGQVTRDALRAIAALPEVVEIADGTAPLTIG